MPVADNILQPSLDISKFRAAAHGFHSLCFCGCGHPDYLHHAKRKSPSAEPDALIQFRLQDTRYALENFEAIAYTIPLLTPTTASPSPEPSTAPSSDLPSTTCADPRSGALHETRDNVKGLRSQHQSPTLHPIISTRKEKINDSRSKNKKDLSPSSSQSRGYKRGRYKMSASLRPILTRSVLKAALSKGDCRIFLLPGL